MRTPHPVRVGNTACERFELDILGALVQIMLVGAEVLCGTAGARAEEYDVRRRSRVADFSRGFRHLTPMSVACDIRAAGAGAK
jgi:hypothetical protein